MFVRSVCVSLKIVRSLSPFAVSLRFMLCLCLFGTIRERKRNCPTATGMGWDPEEKTNIFLEMNKASLLNTSYWHWITDTVRRNDKNILNS